MVHLDLDSDLGHVESPHLVDQELQGGAWQDAWLLKKQDTIAKHHQSRDRLNAEGRSQPGLLLGVNLGKVTSGLAAEVFSKMGAKARHGPHQGAHQSTSAMPPSTVIPKFPGLSSFVAMAKVLSLHWSQRLSKGFAKEFGKNPRARGDRLNMR